MSEVIAKVTAINNRQIEGELVGKLVRCKDCIHYDADTQSCLDGLDGIFQPDWFCADGERKET